MNWYISALKKYAVFQGRARRKEYWYFFLLNVIIAFCLGFLEGIMRINYASGHSILADIYQLAVLLPSIGVAIRRMHDVGKSGWFILVPIYNLILAIKPGDKAENRFGADPIAETEQ
jgi:uncharacterized membrane protein YhaH (DUF805 family)